MFNKKKKGILINKKGHIAYNCSRKKKITISLKFFIQNNSSQRKD